jgi:hypothetical protein
VLPQLSEHGTSGSDREWIAGERSCLINRTDGSDTIHDVSTPAIGSKRHSSPDDLSQSAQIRRHPESLLRAPIGKSETGHDLIEQKQHSMLTGQGTQAMQKAGSRCDTAHISGDRFNNNRSNFTLVVSEQIFNLLKIIIPCQATIILSIKRR